MRVAGEAVGRWHHVVLDCADPEALAPFWCAVLGVDVQHRFAQYVMLEPTAAGGPGLCLQAVGEPKAAKNRMHLDLAVADLDAAVARIESLGGRLLHAVAEDGVDLRVCADPEGNELCLVRADA